MAQRADRRIRRGAFSLLTFLLLMVAGALPASAHAERVEARPAEGEKADAPPEELYIRFTEPPTGDAVVSVLDGCEREVVSGIDVSNQEITAALEDGQPGKWKVSLKLISGLDGHPTTDKWRFSVAGEPDCSTEEPGETAAEPDEEPAEGTSSTLIIGVIGGLALIGVAILVRSLAGRAKD